MTNLADAKKGEKFRVVALPDETAACQRLREMGFCEHAEVCKLTHGGALVCQVCDSKVALSEALARKISVEKLP